jgi:hypothetical protein
MTTNRPQGSSLSTERITVYLDTLLGLTKAIDISSLSCFSSARTAFIHELTDQQLDHIVGKALQLDLTDYIRYCYMEWVREYVGDSDKVEFGKCR